MTARKLRGGFVAMIVVLVGLVGASSAPAATKTTTYPTVCSTMVCGFPNPSTWTDSLSYEGVTCIAPGVLCPTADGGRHARDGLFVVAVNFTGVASVAAAVSHTLTTPTGVRFVYNGAAGAEPDTVTFTIDRAAENQSLIDLGGSASMSVFVDDLDAGTSLTLVDQRPIVPQPFPPARDPSVSVDPSQLTMGHRYAARVVTRVSYPVGVLPNTTVYYHHFRLTATAEDSDDDGIADNADNCPNDSNPGQENFDSDAQGDACDTDDDNDGVPDTTETGCTGTTGAGEPLDTDSDDDGVLDGTDVFPCDPDESTDTDSDGIGDGTDNCVNDANPGQQDTDGDGIGNVCDSTPNGDTDSDGVDNNSDNCPSVANPGQENLDGDALGDACDPDIDGDGVPNGQDPDPRDPNVPGQGVAGATAGSRCFFGAEVTILGTDGPDRIVGTPGRDVINGLGGKDTIVALEGDDLICGGRGGDLIKGGPGDDRVKGSLGNDRIRGNAGSDWLRGGPGNDRISGGSGKDRLMGNRGDDRLRGRRGNDLLLGGPGRDRGSGGPGRDKGFSLETALSIGTS